MERIIFVRGEWVRPSVTTYPRREEPDLSEQTKLLRKTATSCRYPMWLLFKEDSDKHLLFANQKVLLLPDFN